MKKTAIVLFLGLVLVFGVLGNADASLVTATVTADNHYAIFFGTDTSLTYVGRNEIGPGGDPVGTYNWSAAETFAAFTVPNNEYIYVVAWSDNNVAQGWKGQFVSDAGTIYSDSSWQYLLSSTDLGDSSPAPSEADVIANIGNRAWLSGVNTTAYSGWTAVTGLNDPSAQWIWGSSMEPGSGYGEYQIFRHSGPDSSTPPVPVPPTVWLLGSGLLGLVGLRRKFRK